MSHIGSIDCQREGKMNAMWRDLRTVFADLSAPDYQRCVLVQAQGADSPRAGRHNKQNLRLPPLANPGPQAYAYADHREHQEGVMAFLEKRPSAF